MIDPIILELIRCPLDGQPLSMAPTELIERINREIAQQSVRDRADGRVTEALDEGLITADGTRLYPVRGGIPTLVANSAIPMQ